MEDVAAALTRAIALLDHSRGSEWVWKTPEQLAERLRRELRSLEETGECDLRELVDLFAPMNSLHDTAIDNGWEEAFAEIVAVVDEFTAG